MVFLLLFLKRIYISEIINRTNVLCCMGFLLKFLNVFFEE